MHVLFVTTARFDQSPYGDGSTRYRCFNLAEELRACGHQADVSTLADLSFQYLERYDIISVLRPRHDQRLQRLINLALQKRIHLVADFDDLIFDPALAIESPLVVNGFSDLERVKHTFGRHRKALNLFDEITVSTQPLLESVEAFVKDKPVTLVRNGLSRYWLAHCENLKGSQSDIVTLTYLPGSRSHDEDFRKVQNVIAQWLGTSTKHRLQMVGDISIDTDIFPSRQVYCLPPVSYFSLPQIIQASSATIAPLISNRFNHAKSHIKFIESAALGVPVICSANADLESHQVDGLYIADTTEDWSLALKKLSDQATVSNQTQVALQAYALEYCTMQVTTRDIISAWNQGISGKSYAAAA